MYGTTIRLILSEPDQKLTVVPQVSQLYYRRAPMEAERGGSRSSDISVSGHPDIWPMACPIMVGRFKIWRRSCNVLRTLKFKISHKHIAFVSHICTDITFTNFRGRSPQIPIENGHSPLTWPLLLLHAYHPPWVWEPHFSKQIAALVTTKTKTFHAGSNGCTRQTAMAMTCSTWNKSNAFQKCPSNHSDLSSDTAAFRPKQIKLIFSLVWKTVPVTITHCNYFVISIHMLLLLFLMHSFV